MTHRKRNHSPSRQKGLRQIKSQDRRRLRKRVMERCGGRCVNCGSREDLTLDHIVPVSKGGKNSRKNLQMLCYDCNQEKADEEAELA